MQNEIQQIFIFWFVYLHLQSDVAMAPGTFVVVPLGQETQYREDAMFLYVPVEQSMHFIPSFEISLPSGQVTEKRHIEF